jgi:iron complex outermembrane receptor protein
MPTFRRLLLIGALWGTLAVTAVGAQDASPALVTEEGSSLTADGDQKPAAAEAERVIVIGSNIPTADEVGPNPVISIDREMIEKSPERTAEQLIKNLPVANANGEATSNNTLGSTAGASSISLRGFDESATLVLIDGRRVASYPAGGGSLGTQSFVDLNSIPAAAIDSIEILTDGASAIYGADAVAGVVNIKFRRDYLGAESFVEYGNTLDKDNSELSASLLFGVGNKTTNISGVVSYYHRNAIFLSDRTYSAVTPFPSSNSSPGNFEVSRAAVIAAGGTPPDATSTNFFASPPELNAGNTPANQYRYALSRISFFNFNAFSSSFPESNRYGDFANLDHKVFGDQMVLYGDASYENVKTVNTPAAAATGSFQSPGQAVLAIPPNSPGAVLGGPTYEETGLALGSFNPFNPFQQIISGGSRLRLAEFGDRVVNNETDAFFATAAVKGDKLFDGSWGYDGGYRYSQVQNSFGGNFVSISKFNRILNAADPIFDPSSAQYIGTTVPYNPFGDYRVPIPTNNAAVAFATAHPSEVDLSKVSTADLTIYTTSLFPLPAGGIGLALGGQFRWESIDQRPDQSLLAGDVFGYPAVFPTSASRESYGIYAEAKIPIFSSTYSIPGFHALEFTTSGRFETYLNNYTNILVPKLGMRWQPLDETLTVRATWGEGFREPSLFELYGSPIQFTLPVFDPRTGNFDPETHILLNNNPKLDPEDAHEFSAGVVYSPKFVPGLTISLDVFDIERTGVVLHPDINELFAREAAGTLLPGEVIERDAGGNVTRIVGPYENGGAQKARGIDIGLQYQLATSFGTFTSLTQATYLDSFKRAATQSSPQLELNGQGIEGASSDAYLKWKGRSRLSWTWQQVDLNMTTTYTGGFHEDLSSLGFQHFVRATWVFNLQASYEFKFQTVVEKEPVAGYSKDIQSTSPSANPDAQSANYFSTFGRRLLNGTRITIGCNNVFDQDPPQAFLTSANYPDFLYDSVGRFVYVSLTKKF